MHTEISCKVEDCDNRLSCGICGIDRVEVSPFGNCKTFKLRKPAKSHGDSK